MKKYKLIKEYPGSPKIGTIIVDTNPINGAKDAYFSENYGNMGEIGFIYTKKLNVENNPEFWQEVVELDYEIFGYEYNGTIYSLVDGFGYRTEDDRVAADVSFMNIYQIVRKSDNEVFTVGDSVINGNYHKSQVISFNMSSDKLIVKTLPTLNGEIYRDDYLANIKKVKKPLFVTEDGVAISEGDKFYSIYPDFTILQGSMSQYPFQISATENIINFSTKKAAQSYIDENKPKYSEKDMISFGKDIQSRFIKPTWPVSEFFKTWKGKNGKK